MRLSVHPVLLAAGLLLPLVGFSYAADSADVALFGKELGDGNGYACFVRHYDAAHLRGHKLQNVTDMTVFVASTRSEDGGDRNHQIGIGVNFRGVDHQMQVSGYCGTSVEGQQSLLNCGIDCDGGQIDVTMKDADAMLVSIPYGARTWDPTEDTESGDEPAANPAAEFGSDDKLFKLDRTDLSECAVLVYDETMQAEIAALK